MLVRLALWITVLTVTTCLVGCEQTDMKPSSDSEPVTAQDVKDQMKEAADMTGQFAAEKKDELMGALDEKLQELDKSIAEMKEKGDNLAQDAKEKWTETLHDLEAKRKVFQAKKDELAGASGEAWKDLRQGLSTAWSDLQKAADDAARHFDKLE